MNRPSRKPLQWGGLAGYQQLLALHEVLQQVAADEQTAYLGILASRVERVVTQHCARAHDLAQAHAWLQRIAECLRSATTVEMKQDGESPQRSSVQVRAAMEQLLAAFPADLAYQPAQAALERSWRRLWRTWGPELLHCYDVAHLPADNMQLEGVFGQLRRGQRRISGCKSTAPLRELGAFQILLRAEHMEELLGQLREVDVAAYWEQRRRVAASEVGRQQLRRLHRDPSKTVQQLVAQHAVRRAELLTVDTPSCHTD